MTRYRLLPLVFGVPLLPIGLFVYGWTAQYKVHWIVPIIFTSFTGAGLVFSFVTQVLDLYALMAFNLTCTLGSYTNLHGRRFHKIRRECPCRDECCTKHIRRMFTHCWLVDVLRAGIWMGELPIAVIAADHHFMGLYRDN